MVTYYIIFIININEILIFILYLSTTFIITNSNNNNFNIISIFTKIFITLFAILSIFIIINKISKIFDTFKIKRLLITLIIFSILTVINELLINIKKNSKLNYLYLRIFDYILDILYLTIMTFLQVIFF